MYTNKEFKIFLIFIDFIYQNLNFSRVSQHKKNMNVLNSTEHFSDWKLIEK
jgi:hypothetical protein